MTDAGYIFLGYGVTAAAIAGYALRLLWRCRNAARPFAGEEQPWR